jgi:glycosyltransferase involved in cell wall biosynthesis
MRIAVHAGTLRGFGSGHVGRNVLENLARIGSQHTFLAWVPESWRQDHGVTQETSPPNVELRFTEPGLLRKLTLENRTIRAALRSWRADVLFSVGDTSLVRCPIPHLLLIHQANLAYGNSDRGFEPPLKDRLRWSAMSRYLRMGLPSTEQVTVQTQDMAARISQRFGFDPSRIVVVPSAVERQGDLAPVEASATPNPYIVYVASASRHKNFEVLPAMMAELRGSCPELTCRLTITREALPELVEAIDALGLSDQFVFEGHLTREGALTLLGGATCLVMPSWLESFGLPYYEAMMLGVPVVAAERGFAREALGDAGLYADPAQGAEFAQAVARLVLDPDERRARSSAVRDRFDETARTWEQVAGRYLELLEDLHVPGGDAL